MARHSATSRCGCDDDRVQQVDIQPAALDRLAESLTSAQANRLLAAAARARTVLAGRVVWNVNSTAHGGGVAEMLQTLLSYGRGAGVDTRWLVLEGDADFFAITKRLHNALHGDAGDGGNLGEDEHAHYQRVLAANLGAMTAEIRADDIVLLHDPQPAGLGDRLRSAGARVVWRCHVGRDTRNQRSDVGWEFLRRYVQNADAFVFSRRQYAPSWVPADRLWIIPPSIDPFSGKNRELTPAQVSGVLHRTGLLDGGDTAGGLAFTRRDGTSGVVRAHEDLVLDGPPPPADARLVVQVSRWDRLKDMPGVLTGFAKHLVSDPDNVHLALVGPDVAGVADDPESAQVLTECRSVRDALPARVRERTHLLCLPMDDGDENAIIVNALQRHAEVVVQKSLVEGFGLTVTEAMWKARPVLASAVGGIQDQIADGRDGLLLRDPRDLDAFGAALSRLLDDRRLAARLGTAARQRVQDGQLGDRHLVQYADLFCRLGP
jgi:trehalose synthase